MGDVTEITSVDFTTEARRHGRKLGVAHSRGRPWHMILERRRGRLRSIIVSGRKYGYYFA